IPYKTTKNKSCRQKARIERQSSFALNCGTVLITLSTLWKFLWITFSFSKYYLYGRRTPRFSSLPSSSFFPHSPSFSTAFHNACPHAVHSGQKVKPPLF